MVARREGKAGRRTSAESEAMAGVRSRVNLLSFVSVTTFASRSRTSLHATRTIYVTCAADENVRQFAEAARQEEEETRPHTFSYSAFFNLLFSSVIDENHIRCS